MSVSMTSAEYVKYLILAGKEIEKNGDYVTELDAKTGDGDHWINLNSGFQKLISMEAELSELSLSDMLKTVGMTLMSSIGGSSGLLYGAGYIAASKAMKNTTVLDINSLLQLLQAELNAIMERGKARPGWKTMIDSLYEGILAYDVSLKEGKSDEEVLKALKEGAHQGMEHTREMEAVKGRASYQINKGVGDLDPGAVTMCIQLECLADYLLNK